MGLCTNVRGHLLLQIKENKENKKKKKKSLKTSERSKLTLSYYLFFHIMQNQTDIEGEINMWIDYSIIQQITLSIFIKKHFV